MSFLHWLNKMKFKTKGQGSAIIHSPEINIPAVAEEPSEPSSSMDARLQWFEHKLAHCSDLVIHTFVAGAQIQCSLLYFKGMVDRNVLQQDVLKTILTWNSSLLPNDFAKLVFEQKQLPVDIVNVLSTLQEALLAVLGGKAVLLVDGDPRILEMEITSFEKRNVSEAPNEGVIKGPREAFIENLEVNLTLIRRRLQSESFKTDLMKIGRHTQTAVVIAYLDGICRQEVVDEVRKRLSCIEIDGVLSTNYLEEFIEDNPYSPFPQIQYTERPDTVAASLLDGRVAVLVDGAPNALLAPSTNFMFMQSAEDYYQRYISSSWIRWIRYVFLFVSLLLPSIYIALTTVHPEIIPDRLLKTIASSREVVPFPALVEAFLMEIFFEALREASIRIPKAMGQAVSIIGALIIGTAAVQAGIVSPVMVIIVSLTGIASFIIPHFDLGLSVRLLRFPMMLLAGTFGLFGIACGLILIYIHLIELRSFGVPFLSPFAPLKLSDLKDVAVRAPWWAMKKRPDFSSSNRKRQAFHSRKWAQTEEEEGD